MMKNDILAEIVANKRFEVAFQKRSIPLEALQDNLTDIQPKYSMREALARSSSGIIAEFKRRSPSKGWINHAAKAEEIVPGYAEAGAAALSVLTDEKYFGGTLQHIRTVRPLVKIPILRKEFIIDEYQLYQAKIVGADAILLIAAVLDEEKSHELTEKAHRIGLEVLLEIHHESELRYIRPDTDMVGVNNRNLKTFHTEIEKSFGLAELLPEDQVLVSESGISDSLIVNQLRAKNFRGFLIGEPFMKTRDPGNTLKEFISQITNKKQNETS